MFFLQIRGRHLYKLVCSIIASYELSRRYLKEKESTDKLDTLKSPTTPLSHRTAIPTWVYFFIVECNSWRLSAGHFRPILKRSLVG